MIRKLQTRLKAVGAVYYSYGNARSVGSVAVAVSLGLLLDKFVGERRI